MEWVDSQDSFRRFQHWLAATPSSPLGHEDEAPPPLSLLDLDDALLLSIICLFPTKTAGKISRTRKALHALASDGRVWRAMLADRFTHLAVDRWPLEQWGVPSHRVLLQAVEEYVTRWTGGFFVLLSDHPWCQLVSIRLERARLVGVALRFRCVDGTIERQEEHSPLFTIRFEATRSGVPHMVPDVAGRSGEVSELIPHSTEPGDFRAAVASTPFPPTVPYAFLAGVHSQREVLRICWQPRERATSHDDDPMVTAADHLPVPPLSSDWVRRNIEQRWRLAKSSPLTNDPKRNLSATLAICRPPMGGSSLEAAQWRLPAGLDASLMPQPGLYCADIGPDERSTQVIALRVERIHGHGDNAKLCALQLQAEPSSRTGRCLLVATKICGDLHIPAGATAFYVPLKHRGTKSEKGVLAEPLLDDDGSDDEGVGELVAASWRGHGCCANLGFQGPVFMDGLLCVLQGGSAFCFKFLGAGMPCHTYYRIPDAA